MFLAIMKTHNPKKLQLGPLSPQICVPNFRAIHPGFFLLMQPQHGILSLVLLRTAGPDTKACAPPGRCCTQPGLQFGKHALSNSISSLNQVTQSDRASVYSIINGSYKPES